MLRRTLTSAPTLVSAPVTSRAGEDPAGSDDPGVEALPERPLVLLVEDDFMLRASLAQLLYLEGYEVESSADGAEAIRRLERTPRPSVIVLDLLMPRLNGVQFRAYQRAEPNIAAIPVIVITAVGLRPDVARELELEQVFLK